MVGNVCGEGQRAEHPLMVPVVTLITTGRLATELGVSRSAVLKWHRAGLITPELVTPGNHLRWDAERVREQLRARRKRDE
jgi:DNA-binding transcriptional MerR regulator